MVADLNCYDYTPQLLPVFMGRVFPSSDGIIIVLTSLSWGFIMTFYLPIACKYSNTIRDKVAWLPLKIPHRD